MQKLMLDRERERYQSGRIDWSQNVQVIRTGQRSNFTSLGFPILGETLGNNLWVQGCVGGLAQLLTFGSATYSGTSVGPADDAKCCRVQMPEEP